MITPENNPRPIPQRLSVAAFIVDFERCADVEELRATIEEINRSQYRLISVTQDSDDIYTVFFRRCIVG